MFTFWNDFKVKISFELSFLYLLKSFGFLLQNKIETKKSVPYGQGFLPQPAILYFFINFITYFPQIEDSVNTGFGFGETYYYFVLVS